MTLQSNLIFPNIKYLRFASTYVKRFKSWFKFANCVSWTSVISRIVKIYHMNNEYGRLVGDGDDGELLNFVLLAAAPKHDLRFYKKE